MADAPVRKKIEGFATADLSCPHCRVPLHYLHGSHGETRYCALCAFAVHVSQIKGWPMQRWPERVLQLASQDHG